MSISSPDLNNRTTLAIFISSGKTPLVNDRLHSGGGQIHACVPIHTHP